MNHSINCSETTKLSSIKLKKAVKSIMYILAEARNAMFNHALYPCKDLLQNLKESIFQIVFHFLQNPGKFFSSKLFEHLLTATFVAFFTPSSWQFVCFVIKVTKGETLDTKANSLPYSWWEGILSICKNVYIRLKNLQIVLLCFLKNLSFFSCWLHQNLVSINMGLISRRLCFS